MHFVDEGTAAVMNFKSIGLQKHVTLHKTQGCISSCVCSSYDKGFKSGGTGKPAEGKMFIYGAVNSQTGLAGTSNEIYLGQRRSDAAWCG